MPTFIALFFVAALAGASVLYLPQQKVRGEAARADAGATSLLAYRQAVIDYLNAHPGFTGTVPDAALSFAWGYVRDPRWTHVVQPGGAVYVYQAAPASANTDLVLDRLYRKTAASFMVGRNAAGRLVSANGFATGVAVPAVVPDGAILVFGE